MFGLSRVEPKGGLVLIELGNEPIIGWRLYKPTQEAAGVLSCHSGGMGDGGEKGASVGLGGWNNASGQGCMVKLLAAFRRVEVEWLNVLPFGLRSTSLERLVCFNFVRKRLVL